MAAHVLLKKGKRAAASYIHSECVRSVKETPQLSELLDVLLDPTKLIEDWDTVDWCRWLMAAGRTPDEFANTVRRYDNATTCGLVWTPNFVAYRCRTCGISPCMSLCAECFQKGNHEGHDFNMFRSQAGGACDCGDTNVMRESGFCHRHGPKSQVNKPAAPPDLVCVAEAMMPRIIYRLVQHLRDKSSPSVYLKGLQEADAFLNMLHELSEMGAAMRKVMTSALCNPQIYRCLTQELTGNEPRKDSTRSGEKLYQEALASLPHVEPPAEFKVDSPGLQENLVHKTFLEELVFWTVNFEFPQKLVCLLLNMLPDLDYKEAFTRAFVLHYSRISQLLVKSMDSDALSNRVVHVSVQLFSNEDLAYRMAEEMGLLQIMVVSINAMMSKILIQNTLHDHDKNFHYVVDCSDHVMKDHCYWPLVSDLNNLLSHWPVARMFMTDSQLLDMWFLFLVMFQGMNVNRRELIQHIEFEPQSYYAAFSGEYEASSSPMWALVNHLTDPDLLPLTKNVLKHCTTALSNWFDAIGVTLGDLWDPYQVSFHLPLHRYYALFMSQAVKCQGASLSEVMPSIDLLELLMIHPLRVQVAFYEILCGMWVRNGLQIKGQAMSYIQCQFCNSLVDADIYLLQVGAMHLDPDRFVSMVLDRFHVTEWLTFSSSSEERFLHPDHEIPMLESCLVFLATLTTVRTNIGLSESDLARLEMVTLLCMNDKTHSQLLDLMPDKCNSVSHNRDFETLLSQVADYRAPNFETSGTMQQGMYVPKGSTWEVLFDPLYVLLRAVHRRDFQSSLDRYAAHVQQTGKLKACQNPWPPYRIPGPTFDAYKNPIRILQSKTFQAAAFVILYKALKDPNVSDHVISLTVYLLELAVTFSKPVNQTGAMEICHSDPSQMLPITVVDQMFSAWFPTDNLAANLRQVVDCVYLSSHESASSDDDMDTDGLNEDEDSDSEDPLMFFSSGSSSTTMPITHARFGSIAPCRVPLPLPPSTFSSSASASAAPSSLSSTASSGASSSPSTSSSHPGILRSQISLSQVNPDQHTMLGGHQLPPPTTSPSVIVESPLDAPSELPSGSGAREMTQLVSESFRRHGRVVSKVKRFLRPIRFHPLDESSLESDSRALVSADSQTALVSADSRTLVSSSCNDPIWTVEVNESIISLLLKLHAKLSGKPDSYVMSDLEEVTRFGDGPFFVKNLLDKIAQLDHHNKEYIKAERQRLWPQHEDKDAEKSRGEEKRRKAKERQQRLIAEFASRQRQFMEKAKEAHEPMETEGKPASSRPELSFKDKEYDCVICGQTTPSTEDRPVGLVVLLQPSSVLGNRYLDTEGLVLPTNQASYMRLIKLTSGDDHFDQEMENRIEELKRQFSEHYWLLSLNIGWQGGIHVQTCSHHLHLDCHKAYLESLRTQSRQQSLDVTHGEYACPLCRQLANAVLPLCPSIGEQTALVKARPGDNAASVARELVEFLSQQPLPPSRHSPLLTAMNGMMENLTNATLPRYRCYCATPTPQSLFLFVSSIARTNLEMDLVQRGGTLVLAEKARLPRRSCIVPLLYVLSMHMKFLSTEFYTQLLSQVMGLSVEGEDKAKSISIFDKDVPLLIRDITSLLLQILLMLPLHVDIAYFNCLVQNFFNVVFFQVLCQLSLSTSVEQREVLKSETGSEDLKSLLGSCIKNLESSQLYTDDAGDKKLDLSVENLEEVVQAKCLPYLRMAALLRTHVYDEPLPNIEEASDEFGTICVYLELMRSDWKKQGCGAVDALHWAVKPMADVLNTWCADLASFGQRSQFAAHRLLARLHLDWKQPRLLTLPLSYDNIFQFFHRRPCSQCNSIPKEPTVCLVCGTMVCLKENCCKQTGVCEAVRHAVDCGAGTGIYLAVNSSSIIVIRGRKACLWGSVFLDSYGEEDRDLKRGRPLYLSEDRYKLLQSQWLNHAFDHTNKKWILHKDNL